MAEVGWSKDVKGRVVSSTAASIAAASIAAASIAVRQGLKRGLSEKFNFMCFIYLFSVVDGTFASSLRPHYRYRRRNLFNYFILLVVFLFNFSQAYLRVAVSRLEEFLPALRCALLLGLQPALLPQVSRRRVQRRAAAATGP